MLKHARVKCMTLILFEVVHRGGEFQAWCTHPLSAIPIIKANITRSRAVIFFHLERMKLSFSMTSVVENLRLRQRVKEYKFNIFVPPKQDQMWTDEPSDLRLTPAEQLLADLDQCRQQDPFSIGLLIYSARHGRYTPGHANCLSNPMEVLANDARNFPLIVEGAKQGRYVPK